MRRDWILIVVAMLGMGLSATAEANLILNGGFETGAVLNSGFGEVPAPWIGTFSLADTYDDTGVTAMSSMQGFGSPELMNGVSAYEGHRFVGLHSPYSAYGPDGLAQLLAVPLTVGQTYTVSAAMLADNRGAFSGIFANLGAINVNGIRPGGQRDSLGLFAANSAGMIWEQRSLTFTATEAYTYLEFTGDPNSPSAYMGLDAVQLAAVPEPVSLVALGIGLVGLKRRRGNRARHPSQ